MDSILYLLHLKWYHVEGQPCGTDLSCVNDMIHVLFRVKVAFVLTMVDLTELVMGVCGNPA